MKRIKQLGLAVIAALLLALPCIAVSPTNESATSASITDTCSDVCSALTDVYYQGCIDGGGDRFYCFVAAERYNCICYQGCSGGSPSLCLIQ